MQVKKKNNLEIAKYLIDKGANVHKFGNDLKHEHKYVVPLLCAIDNNNYRIIKYLMNQSLDINEERKEKLDESNEENLIYEKPLYYTIKHRKGKITKFILKQKGIEYDVSIIIKSAIVNYGGMGKLWISYWV